MPVQASIETCLITGSGQAPFSPKQNANASKTLPTLLITVVLRIIRP
jgi:hypothetical protein